MLTTLLICLVAVSALNFILILDLQGRSKRIAELVNNDPTHISNIGK